MCESREDNATLLLSRHCLDLSFLRCRPWPFSIILIVAFATQDISSLKVEVLNSVLRCWEPVSKTILEATRSRRRVALRRRPLLEPFAASVQACRRKTVMPRINAIHVNLRRLNDDQTEKTEPAGYSARQFEQQRTAR